MKLTNFVQNLKTQIKNVAPKKTETATNNQIAAPAAPKTEQKNTTVAAQQTGQSILASQNRQLLLNTTQNTASGVTANTARNINSTGKVSTSKQTPGTPTGPTGMPIPKVGDYKTTEDYLKAVENYNNALDSTTGTAGQRPLDKKLDEDLKRLDKEAETINNESFKGIKSSPWEDFKFRQFN